MELVQEIIYSNQFTYFLLPGLVFLGAVLLYKFSYKEQPYPPFHKLTSSEERKGAPKKKKSGSNTTTQQQEKRGPTAANGHAGGEAPSKKSPAKDKKPPKVSAPAAAPVKKQVIDDIVQAKNKKNVQVKKVATPVIEPDDGNWETVPTKADKKKKVEVSPKAISVDPPKNKKAVELEKLVKETVNLELKALKEQQLEDVKANIDIVIEEKKEEKKQEKNKKSPGSKKKKEEKKEKEEKREKEEEKKEKEEEVKVIDNKSQPPPEIIAVVEEPVKGDNHKAAFDELGDIWTEAKAAKKSKKKSRRDN